ncbi:hypothetical protein B0H11DRAFT_543067 [Mycena galericulata]|nr:hypothetical protein B0H11DRAFT_543067 [Mycena galericulata]
MNLHPLSSKWYTLLSLTHFHARTPRHLIVLAHATVARHRPVRARRHLVEEPLHARERPELWPSFHSAVFLTGGPRDDARRARGSARPPRRAQFCHLAPPRPSPLLHLCRSLPLSLSLFSPSHPSPGTHFISSTLVTTGIYPLHAPPSHLFITPRCSIHPTNTDSCVPPLPSLPSWELPCILSTHACVLSQRCDSHVTHRSCDLRKAGG